MMAADSGSVQHNSDQLMHSFPDNSDNGASNNHNGVEIDPKLTSPRCGRPLTQSGALGRHLDLKRGTCLHPAAVVDQIRGNVRRKRNAVESKKTPSQWSKNYNAREDIEQRAKMRRKENKANPEARLRFIQQLGLPNLPLDASFAFFVLYFLPSNQWPDSLRGQDSFDQVAETVEQMTSVNSLDGSRLEVAYARWTVMNVQDQHDTWTKQLRVMLEMTLGSFTAYDIGTRDTWACRGKGERMLRSIEEEKEIHQPESLGGDMSEPHPLAPKLVSERDGYGMRGKERI
jgi:hypothetical protein